MNPNLAILLKRLIMIMLVVALCYLMYFLITTQTAINLKSVFNYLFSVFAAVLITSALLLIVGVVIRMVWPGLMRRSENIHLLCADKSQGGIHIIGSHYYAGGRFTKSYRTFHHYYIDIPSGKMFMSTDISSEVMLERSVKDLSLQTNLSLQPDTDKKVVIGYYQDPQLVETSKFMDVKEGRVEVRSFDVWLDFGFHIAFSKNDQRIWRKTI